MWWRGASPDEWFKGIEACRTEVYTMTDRKRASPDEWFKGIEAGLARRVGKTEVWVRWAGARWEWRAVVVARRIW
jgi:hypothetical protein